MIIIKLYFDIIPQVLLELIIIKVKIIYTITLGKIKIKMIENDY